MAAPEKLRQLLVGLGLPLIAMSLALTGCDKFTGGDDGGDKSDEDKAKTEDKKEESKEDSKEDAKEDAKEEGKEEGKESGPVPEEGDGKIPETKLVDESDKPILLSDMKIIERTGSFAGGSIEIKADGKIQKKIDTGTYVRAKVLCKAGDRFVADVAYINADYSKQLQDHEVGDEADLKGLAFTQGLKEAPKPCQLDFRLSGGGSSTTAIELREACWDGKTVTEGKCDPVIAAAPMSGAKLPIEIKNLEIKPQTGYGAKGGLNAEWMMQVNEPQNENARFTLKTACQVGETKFVDVAHANLMASPFKYESGESVARKATLFYNPAFGFAESPDTCDVSVALWLPKSGSFGEHDKTTLVQSCYKGGKISDGRCDPDATDPPDAKQAEDGSVVITNVGLKIAEPYDGKGDRFQLKIEADARIDKPVDERAGVQAKVTCTVGKTARVETAYLYGTDLYYMGPGETSKMSSTAFTTNALEEKPSKCDVKLTAGKRFASAGEEGINLGSWCLKKDSTKPGDCDGKNKPPEAGGAAAEEPEEEDPPAEDPKEDPPKEEPKADPPKEEPKADPPKEEPKKDPKADPPKADPKADPAGKGGGKGKKKKKKKKGKGKKKKKG